MSLAHQRERQGLNLLLKKMKFSPIVSIQGPRQCGKSYFACKILPQHAKSIEFKTLDNSQLRKLAEDNPRLFLESVNLKHLVIDEVQKVPQLFDEMKAVVDEDRRPGRYVILGSTEFSIEAKIKESLTGRLSRLKMYPMNLSEVRKLKINEQKNFPFLNNKLRVSRQDVLRYLKNGGLPGIFVVKSELERQSLIKDWIDLTVTRDIFQFKNKSLNSEIAESILHQIAILDMPTVGAIASAIGKSSFIVQKHLKALKNLFVIDEIAPAQKSTGKSIFYLCDVGILEFYNAPLLKKITTWLLIELRSQMSYKGVLHDRIHYFKSYRSQPIQFINIYGNTLSAVRVMTSDSADKRDLVIFKSLKKKFPNYKYNFHILYGGTERWRQDDVSLSPWESVV